MNNFEQIVQKTPLDDQAKKALVELYRMLDYEDKTFLYQSIEKAISKPNE